MKSNHYINNADFLVAITDYREKYFLAKENGLQKPRIPEYIGMCFMKIAENVAKKKNFAGYCVDESTEALTDRGWLKYNEMSVNDRILSVDPVDFTLKWSKIKSIYLNENFSGKCFKIDGKIDALVTPGHKFLTKRGLLKIDEIHQKDHILVNGNAIVNDEKIYDDNFVRLVGWFTTEGSVARYNKKRDNKQSIYTSFSQSKKSKYYSNIIDMLSSFYPNEYNVYERTRNNDISITVSIKGSLREKLLEVVDVEEGNKAVKYEFINKLTTNQLRILKDTYIAGDGFGMQFVQKCKRNFDAYLYVCALLGERVSFIKYSNSIGYGATQENNWFWVATTQRNPNKFCVVEKLNFNGKIKSRGGVKRNNTPNYDYSGPVWCPETEYGTFVCRRNGRIYVTGNSFKDEMILDALENCVQVCHNFDPEKSSNPFAYFTQITHFAFVRRIVKEKKQLYIKYKSTEQIGILDNALLEDENGNTKQFELYGNLVEYIEDYEEALELKKQKRLQNIEEYYDGEDE